MEARNTPSDLLLLAHAPVDQLIVGAFHNARSKYALRSGTLRRIRAISDTGMISPYPISASRNRAPMPQTIQPKRSTNANPLWWRLPQ
jgi:hypothetical protein